MKKYIYKLGILCALSGLLFSCQITEVPTTSITEEELTPDAIKSIVLGNYAQLKTRSFTKGFHYLGEYGSDNVALSGQTTDALFYIYNFQRIKDNGHLANQWGIFNRIIVNCNKIIDQNKEGQNKEMDHLLGECYFLRGWINYQLAQTFGRTYHKATESDLGTPVKLSWDINEFPARATVKKQYEQIVKDLLKAEKIMGESGIKKESIYANVWAAKALLSRVYLTMHDYENAEKYATDVIDKSGKTLIGTSAYAAMNEIVPESNPEAIFAIRRVKDIDNDDPYNEVGSLYASIDGAGWGEMYASEPLRELLDRYQNDVRNAFIKPIYADVKDGELILEFETKTRNYLINDKGEGDPAIQGKYRTYFRFGGVKEVAPGRYEFPATDAIANHELRSVEVQKDAQGVYVEIRQVRTKEDKTKIYSSWIKSYGKVQKKMARRNDYPKYYMTKCSYQEKQTHMWSPMILRLSEMYLNRAEARYYRGNQSGAIDDINVIKNRAGISAYNAAIDGADVLVAILDERRRELYLEAQRFFDLMRNDMPLDRAYPGGHDRGATSVVKLTVVNTDNCAIQYIPQREINAYPIELTQNPD